MRGMTAGAADDEGARQELAALVHELNNVLSAVLGYAEIVHADASDGSVDEADARQILAAARRAIELTDALAARITGGSEPPDAA